MFRCYGTNISANLSNLWLIKTFTIQRGANSNERNLLSISQMLSK